MSTIQSGKKESVGMNDKLLDQIKNFVKNGGRIRAGEEPVYGEPFYGAYMQQYISANFALGDKVSITTEKTFDGIIIDIGPYHLTTLTSGRSVHKDRRNKCSEPFSDIKSIELIKKTDGKFDLSVVDPREHERRMNIKKLKETGEWEEIENKKTWARMERRAELKKQFTSIYHDVDYDSSHVIQIMHGCSNYFPFRCAKVEADLYLILDNGIIKKIPCQTGAPFPNKNSYHAYNYDSKQDDPCLYLYLPDDGTVYENVNIACIWTMHVLDDAGDTWGIKMINLYRIGRIKPISDERNLIPIDMGISPLLGYNTIKDCGTLLEDMMAKDVYCIMDSPAEDNDNYEGLHMIKVPEDIHEMRSMAKILYKLDKYCGNQPTNDFLISANIETFVTIDKEAYCYYTDSWITCRDGYPYKMLDAPKE